jgi:hypothetical protein
MKCFPIQDRAKERSYSGDYRRALPVNGKGRSPVSVRGNPNSEERTKRNPFGIEVVGRTCNDIVNFSGMIDILFEVSSALD